MVGAKLSKVRGVIDYKGKQKSVNHGPVAIINGNRAFLMQVNVFTDDTVAFGKKWVLLSEGIKYLLFFCLIIKFTSF